MDSSKETYLQALILKQKSDLNDTDKRNLNCLLMAQNQCALIENRMSSTAAIQTLLNISECTVPKRTYASISAKKNWSSGLSSHNVMEMPCVQRFKSKAQKARASLVPELRMDEPFPTSNNILNRQSVDVTSSRTTTENRSAIPSGSDFKSAAFIHDKNQQKRMKMRDHQQGSSGFLRDPQQGSSGFQPKNHFLQEKNSARFSEPFRQKQGSSHKERENNERFGADENPLRSCNPRGKRSLGARRGPHSAFVSPLMDREDDEDNQYAQQQRGKQGKSMKNSSDSNDEPVDERLKNIEPKMIELITNEIMDHGPEMSWEDIAGLEFAKKTIKEIIVWPLLRPDIFTGLRGPPKGLLLFGPPGTGKTLIGKCIASQSKSTFFSISASSLTSKWVGEGEKMVRALFAVARVHQPSVVFIDEIDSLLTQRTDGENEASRRIKTEFLVQLDGAGTSGEDRILVVGATNRPQEIDEAARRRFVKRLYIPLPESIARRQIVTNLLTTQKHELQSKDFDDICEQTEGYSGADMANLCREAALGPIRSISFEEIERITAEEVRPITHADFELAVKRVRPSVSQNDLHLYLDWNKQFGSWDL